MSNLIKLITAVQAIGVLDRDGEPGGITGHYDLVDTTIGHEDLADLFHIYRNFQTFWKKNTISLFFVDTIYIQKRIWLKHPIMIVTLRWPCVCPNLVCKMIIWRFDWYPPPLACFKNVSYLTRRKLFYLNFYSLWLTKPINWCKSVRIKKRWNAPLFQ